MEAAPKLKAFAKADTIIWIGKTMARAAIAKGPTPCPTKIVSTTLYSALTIMPTAAGIPILRRRGKIASRPRKSVLWEVVIRLFASYCPGDPSGLDFEIQDISFPNDKQALTCMSIVFKFILCRYMEATKDRILNAALELFAEKGYSAVSTKAIARAAAVNEVTLFRSFGSKRNLYLGVYRRFSVKVDKETILRDITYDLERDLVHIDRSFAAIYNDTSKVVRMSLKDVREEFKEIDDDLKRQIDSISATFALYFKEQKKRGKIEKDPDQLARLFTGIFYGYALYLSKQNALDQLERDVLELTSIFVHGLAKR